MIRQAWAQSVLSVSSVLIVAGWLATATPAHADCKPSYAEDGIVQPPCAIAESQPAPPDAPSKSPALVPPLAHLQVIFNFYDRRFPGFNGGLEHLGVDFSAAAGTPVVAMCDGTVVSSTVGQAEIVAVVLIIEHDCPPPLGRVYGYYGHLHSDYVVGDAMAAGAKIGVVREWPGNSHLHFGLSTQWVEENWGYLPRGATLAGIVSQGWLNPLSYFTAAVPPPAPTSPPRVLKRVAPQPAVHRQNRPGNVRRKR